MGSHPDFSFGPHHQRQHPALGPRFPALASEHRDSMRPEVTSHRHGIAWWLGHYIVFAAAISGALLMCGYHPWVDHLFKAVLGD